MTPDFLVPVLIGVSGVLFACGLACLASRRNLVKMVLGVEFLGKAASLLVVLGGRLHGDAGRSQAMVFTIVVIEVAVAAVALALVVVARRSLGADDAGALAARGRSGNP